MLIRSVLQITIKVPIYPLIISQTNKFNKKDKNYYSEKFLIGSKSIKRLDSERWNLKNSWVECE